MAATYSEKLARFESNGNPNAKNPNSTASGQHQFIDSTWNQMLEELGLPRGTSRQDPEASELVLNHFRKKNRAHIDPILGRPAQESEEAVAHLLGGQGAAKFLAMDPNSPSSKAVSDDAYKLNKRVFRNESGRERTVGEVLAFYGKEFDEAAANSPPAKITAMADTPKNESPKVASKTEEQPAKEQPKPQEQTASVQRDDVDPDDDSHDSKFEQANDQAVEFESPEAQKPTAGLLNKRYGSKDMKMKMPSMPTEKKTKVAMKQGPAGTGTVMADGGQAESSIGNVVSSALAYAKLVRKIDNKIEEDHKKQIAQEAQESFLEPIDQYEAENKISDEELEKQYRTYKDGGMTGKGSNLKYLRNFAAKHGTVKKAGGGGVPKAVAVPALGKLQGNASNPSNIDPNKVAESLYMHTSADGDAQQAGELPTFAASPTKSVGQIKLPSAASAGNQAGSSIPSYNGFTPNLGNLSPGVSVKAPQSAQTTLEQVDNYIGQEQAGAAQGNIPDYSSVLRNASSAMQPKVTYIYGPGSSGYQDPNPWQGGGGNARRGGMIGKRKK